MDGASWGWTGDAPVADIVIMAKAFGRAKSRLAGLPGQLRADVCAALLHDTLAAVHPVADRIVVVSDQPDLAQTLVRWGHRGVLTLADPGGGLNAAVRAGDQFLGAAPYPRPRLAMVADLPGLCPDELRTIIGQVAGHQAAFVPDAAGTGTTMVGSGTGPLDPHFGPGSADRHRAAGAVAVSAGPGARLDVDTRDDLAAATRAGLGPALQRLLPSIDTADTAEGAWNDPDPSWCA